MTCFAQSWPALVTTAAPTAMGASDMASFWMVGPPLRDRAADTPPPMIPKEFAGFTTASTGIAVMSLFARCICITKSDSRKGNVASLAGARAKKAQEEGQEETRSFPRRAGWWLGRQSAQLFQQLSSCSSSADLRYQLLDLLLDVTL